MAKKKCSSSSCKKSCSKSKTKTTKPKAKKTKGEVFDNRLESVEAYQSSYKQPNMFSKIYRYFFPVR